MNRETDLAVVERDAPKFVSNLTKSTGTGIGLELSESGLIINVKNDKILSVNATTLWKKLNACKEIKEMKTKGFECNP
ncbi:hypothetical protein CQW23_33259 [Capsicum baccatum]|uniref:Uncharacterized protein n=1 Tax=Capsicum baccatum TaxID=33114 RepID=A0A2G2V2C7_CAPBA|nr:hypothetical protein CQW23_33259 [Capsicum baccatum]